MNESIILREPEQTVYIVLEMSHQNFIESNSIKNISVFYTREDADSYIYQSRHRSKMIVTTGQLNPSGNTSYLN